MLIFNDNSPAIDLHKKLLADQEPFNRELAQQMESIRYGLKNSNSITKLNNIGSVNPYPSTLKLYTEGIVSGPLEGRRTPTPKQTHNPYEGLASVPLTTRGEETSRNICSGSQRVSPRLSPTAAQREK